MAAEPYAGRPRLLDPAPGALLGICPLLAKAAGLAPALAMGLAAWLALVASALTVAALRRFIPGQPRILFILLIAGTWVTVLDLALAAWNFPLHTRLGLYLPLLAANCLLLSVIETGALLSGPLAAGRRAAAAGFAVFLWVAAVGLVRELAGGGEPGLLAGAGIGRGGLALLSGAPGAFLVFGLLLALGNAAAGRRQRASGPPA